MICFVCNNICFIWEWDEEKFLYVIDLLCRLMERDEDYWENYIIWGIEFVMVDYILYKIFVFVYLLMYKCFRRDILSELDRFY